MHPRRVCLLLLGLTALALCLPAEAQIVARLRADTSGAGPYALQLARRAFDTYCLTRTPITIPSDLPPLLQQRAGVFVSGQVDGAPRCCMGLLRPRGRNLAADIISAAIAAAAHDERFAPLQPKELSHLRLIVSVLDPPQAIADPAGLDPLTDGLAVRSSCRTGVVLPGETGLTDRFVSWALTRAAARAGEPVQYFRLQAIRYIEPPSQQARLWR